MLELAGWRIALSPLASRSPGVVLPRASNGLPCHIPPGNICGLNEFTERSPLAVAFFARGVPRPRQVDRRVLVVINDPTPRNVGNAT
jgi:hypothetical protein